MPKLPTPNNLLTIQKAAEKLGVSTKTLRRWEDSGYLKPERTLGNQRRYTLGDLDALKHRKSSNFQLPITNFQSSSNSQIPNSNIPLQYPASNVQLPTSPSTSLRVNNYEPVEYTGPKLASEGLALQTQQATRDTEHAIRNTQYVSRITYSVSRFPSPSRFGVLFSCLLVLSLLSSHLSLADLTDFPTLKRLVSESRLISKKAATLLTNDNQTKDLVLAAQTNLQDFVFNVNVPTNLNDILTVSGNAEFQGTVTGTTADFKTSVTTGKLTAPNVIYSLVAGSGISVSTGQTPTITNTGVLSVGGTTGAVTLSAGSGISVSGLSITNSDLGSAQNIFKTIKVTGQDNITASSNTDSLIFAGTDGITATTSATTKTVTFSASGSLLNVSGWFRDPGIVRLLTSTDNVGIGTTNPQFKLDVLGSLGISGVSYFAGNVGIGTTDPQYTLDVNGTIRVAGASVLNGINNNNGGITNAGPITGATGLTSSGTITFSDLSTGIVHSNFTGVLSSSAVDLANGDVSGTLPTVRGGTGLTAYNMGDLPYASATNILSNLGVGATGQVLTVANGVPTWGTVSGLGGFCTDCVLTDPGSTQTIIPSGTATTGLVITKASGGTVDLFRVANYGDTISYLRVDSTGNVILGNGGMSTGTFTVNPANTDPISISPVGQGSTAYTGTITSSVLTDNRTWTFPDLSGLICLETGNCAGLGSNIGGSGTANYITKWQGVYALTNSSLYDNGSIGIGLTNPGSNLSVAGNLSIGSTYASIAAPVNGAIFQGSVGIGTTNPTSTLYVEGTQTTSGTVSLLSTLGVTGATTLSSTLGVTGTTTIGGALQVNGLANSWFTGNLGIGTTAPTGLFQIGIGATTAFFVNASTGYVGIGTVAPSAKLDVSGNINLSSGADRTIQVGTGGSIGNNLTVTAGSGCFLSGTKVSLADGGSKNIEEIKVGEKVLSFEESKQATAVSEVTKVFHHTAEQMTGDYYLIITTENGAIIKVTINHPIYSNGIWKQAGDLMIGDPLLNNKNEVDKITGIEKVYQKTLTYNLEVANYHDYFAEGLLVHNKPVATYTGGNLYLTGGAGFGTNGTGGNTYIYGGTPGSGGTAGNLILAQTGSVVQGLVGIGTTNPISLLSVGTNSEFQVNSTGNLVRINDIPYSWPSGQGAAGSVLTNGGDVNGTLTWGAPSGTGPLGYWQRNGTYLAPSNIGDSVGIGTTSPTAGYALDISTGNLRVGGTANMGSAIVGSLTGMIKGTSGTLSAVTGNTGYNTYWSDDNTLGSEQYLNVSRGGTGLSGASAGNGTLLIGNGTGYTLANLTAGVGIGITNSSGAITISNSLPWTDSSGSYIQNQYTTAQNASLMISGNAGIGGSAYFLSNVGIGTSSPTAGYALDIATGNLRVGGTSYFASNVGIGTTNPTGLFQIGIGATTAFFVNATNGNVGIGTVAPGAKLEVTGDMYLSSGADRTIKVVSGTAAVGNNLTVAAAAGTCFLSGTKVSMADGSYKNIEEVLIGEKVLSFDELKKETTISTVFKVYHHTIEEMLDDYYLIIKTEKGAKIQVTPLHRFYSNGAWKHANELIIGDSLLNDKNETDKIIGLEKVYQKLPTYNLEIEKYHVYYAEGILVHNSGKVTSNIGGNLYLAAGAAGGTGGSANGGNTYVYGGAPYGAGVAGNVILANTGSVAQGNVGIGTTTPASLLDVNGTAWLRGTGTSGLYVDSSGNVGIGTTAVTSGYALDISTGNLRVGGTANMGSAIVGTLTGMIKGTSGTLSAVTGNTGYNAYWSDDNTLGSEQYLNVSRGGTGLSGASAGNGTLLIGNGTGYTLANLTAGVGIGVSNASGSITLTNTAPWTDSSGSYIQNQYTTAQNASLRISGNAGIGGSAYILSNLGIGTSSPTAGYALDIATGNLRVGGTAYFASNVGIGISAPTSLLHLFSTSTSTTFTGQTIDWQPTAQTTSTGDLLSINIGSSGLIGNLLNIKDNGSSVFSVSQTAITGNIPASFTAAGDVSIANDLTFTNSMSSYINSAAPLYLQAGEVFNSSDLTLRTFNAGNVIVDSQAFVTNYSATVSGQLVVGTATPDSANIGALYVTNASTYNKALAIFNQTESQDILTASASGTTRLSLTNTGSLGIGATTPAALLDVQGTTWLRGTGTSGLFVNSSGYVGIGKTNPTGVFQIGIGATTPFFINATTGAIGIGTTNPVGIFNINIGATNPLVILSSGNVGIGTTNPTYKLDVNGSLGVAGTAYFASSVGIGTTNPGAYKLNLVGARAYCDQTSCWTDASDIALKQDIASLNYGLSDVMQMNPVSFTMKNDGSYGIGFIAQDMENIIPEVVNGVEGQKGIAYGNLTPVLVKAIQEQQGQLNNFQLSMTNLQSISNDPIIENLKTADASMSAELASLKEEIANINVGMNASATNSAELINFTAENASISGSLMVLGKTTVSDLGVTGTITAGLMTIDGLNGEINTLADSLKLQSLALGNIEMQGAQVIIDTKGNISTQGTITAKEIQTNKLVILDPVIPSVNEGSFLEDSSVSPQNDNASSSAVLATSIGKVIIPTGETETEVNTTALTNNSLIFITPENLPVPISASKSGETSFIIKLSKPEVKDLKVNWWIVN